MTYDIKRRYNNNMTTTVLLIVPRFLYSRWSMTAFSPSRRVTFFIPTNQWIPNNTYISVTPILTMYVLCGRHKPGRFRMMQVGCYLYTLGRKLYNIVLKVLPCCGLKILIINKYNDYNISIDCIMTWCGHYCVFDSDWMFSYTREKLQKYTQIQFSRG